MQESCLILSYLKLSKLIYICIFLVVSVKSLCSSDVLSQWLIVNTNQVRLTNKHCFSQILTRMKEANSRSNLPGECS